MPKKKSKKVKKNGKGVGGKADVHAHEEGKRNKSLLGYNSIFTPEVIDDIHIKSQLGRYRMRGMALMKKIPTFDDLQLTKVMCIGPLQCRSWHRRKTLCMVNLGW